MLRRTASARSWLRPFRARIGLVCLALALLLVPVGIASNGTHVSGTISANTTWTLAGSPYVLDGNVTVAAGVTLTIDPGVVVKLNGQLRYLWVSGTLKAVGTQAQPIVFTSIQDDTVGGDSNGDGAASSPAPGQWYEIGINAGSASELRYAIVRYGGWGSANYGYGAISVNGAGTSATIDHATITNNQRSGVKIYLGGATISASTISGNANGISANQGWMALKDRSFVTGNSVDGVWFNLTSTYTGPASSLMDSDVAGNGRFGVTIGTQPTLASVYLPHGNRNNIYGNASKQLENYYTRSDVDWSGNFWGASMYHWTNPSVCQGAGQNSRGRLAPRPTSQTPGDGPISSSAYTAGSPSVLCYYDKMKIRPDEFSPYYLGNTPVIPITQAYGGLTATGHSKSLSVLREDPVNAATGSFTHETTDLSLPGTGVAFAFTRSYNSLDPSAGSLGQGWQHNHAIALAIRANGDVNARMEDGQRFEYLRQLDGSFTPPAGALSTLASVTGGYELVRNDQVTYRFDSSGKVTSVKDRNDKGLTYAYDGSGRLQTITDAAARQMTLAYDGAGNLTSVATPDGRSVTYGYTSGRLTAVTDAAAKVWTYVYESHGLLEKEIDPLAHTVFRNVYGLDGRVLEQYDALNNKTTFAWDHLTQTSTITDARTKVWKDVFAGNVPTKHIDALNNETQLGHGSALDQTSATSPTGQATTMSYDARGNLTEAVAPASLQSATKTLAYDSDNNVTSVVDARGKVTMYGYDAAGNNNTVTQDGQTVVTYTHDTAGRVFTSTDGRGNSTGYTYDANGNLASVTDPLGNKTTHTYDAAGRMTSRVDPLGNIVGADPNDYKWTWTYDAAGRVLTESNPLGNSTTYTYDDAGNKLTEKDANNETTTYAYDAANRLTSTTAPNGGVTSYTYDAVGNKLTETDPRNNTTTYTYDSNNRLASVTSPLGNKTTHFYDADGNQTKVVEPRGNVVGANPDDYATTSTYDAAGRLLSETNPLGQTTSYTYDKVGNQLTVTDPRGKIMTSTYDGRNRLATVTAPDGAVTSYTYDANGNQLTRIDARGKTWASTYDVANRLASSTTPLGNKTIHFYDANGRQTKVVEPRGNLVGANPDDYATVSTYDRAGRLLTTTDPLGNQSSQTYDAVGNKLSATDAANRTTSYTYDGVNRLASVIAADLTTTSYTYDLAGNLTTRTDPYNHSTTYAFDADGRRTTVTSPIGQIWTTSYDVAGNVAQTVDANGNATQTAGDGTTTNTYDRAGRLTGIDYSDSTPDVTFAYDAAGNRSSMTDGAGTETRAYDDANRLAQVTRGADTFAYVYDLSGNLTRRTYPDSTITDYGFDDDSRMATATSGGTATSYTYDAAGNLTTTTLPATNGHVETRTYDRAGRLTQIGSAKAGTTLVDSAYTLDPVGNPTQVVRTGSLPGTTTYSYDNRHQITDVCYAISCAGATDYIRWTYDAVGNRLTETRPSATTTYSYNAADELTLAGSTSYSYDSNGNRTAAGGRTFAYDLASRTISTTSGGTTTSYSYDGGGNRIQAVVGTQTVTYGWDPNHSLPQLALERDGTNGLIRRYVYGAERLSMTVPGGTSYYHFDHLGSVANVTSAQGAAEWTYSYEPFGTARTEAPTGSPATNLHRFTGEMQDPTGLYHLRARQYDPAIGVFQRTDPVEPDLEQPYVSSYGYTANRPTVLVDPSGAISIPGSQALDAAGIATSSPRRVTSGLGPSIVDPGGASRVSCGRGTWGSSGGYRRYNAEFLGARGLPFPFRLSLSGSATPSCRDRTTMFHWSLSADTSALTSNFGQWRVSGRVEYGWGSGRWLTMCARGSGDSCTSNEFNFPGGLRHGTNFWGTEHYRWINTSSVTFVKLRYQFSVERGVEEGENFHGRELGAILHRGNPAEATLTIDLKQ